jgi:hypothetical protein
MAEIEHYSGDDHVELAEEIERAVRLYGHGGIDFPLKGITFFEGELTLIVKALRAYKP